MPSKILLTIVLAFFIMLRSSGAVPSLTDKAMEWRNVDVDGMRVAVFCIYTDSKGLVWIGTGKGLYLFDGVEPRRVGVGMQYDMQVYAIVEHEGCLYLGTNHGLAVYHCSDGMMDMSNFNKTQETRSMLIANGRLLLGCLNGLFAYDFATKRISNMSRGLPHPSVYCLLCDSHGSLYVGTYKGLARWDKARRRFFTVGALHKEANVFVNCMAESADRQTVYLGTELGLYAYRPYYKDISKVDKIGDIPIKSIAVAADGSIYAGTNDGLFHISTGVVNHYKHDTRILSSIVGDEVWSVMTDKSGNVWIGTERGLSISNRSMVSRLIRISSIIPSGESNEFLAIFRDSKDRLWLGGTHGIIRYGDDGSSRWFHVSARGKSSPNCVRSVMEDSNGTLWLSTDDGVRRYNEGSATFESISLLNSRGRKVSDWTYAVRQIGQNLWVGSYLGGINRFPISEMSSGSGARRAGLSLLNLGNDHISNMVADKDGDLWILYFGDPRLYLYKTATKKVVRFNIRRMTGSDPTNICLDKSGRLWTAYRGGLLVFDGEKRTRITLPKSDGDESVLSMSPVDDGVWVSTMSSVWRIDGSDLRPSLIPLPHKGFSSIWDDAKYGKVILGSHDLIVVVDKSQLAKAQHLGVIRLVMEYSRRENLRAYNLVGTSRDVYMPYDGSLSLLASTLDYSLSSQERIEYKIVKKSSDEEGDWIVMPQGANIITLAKLGFGDYKVLFKTVGSPLKPVSINLTVGMPFYLSWYAILAYIIILVTVVAIIIWYLRRRARRRALEKDRREALANVEHKLTFLSNISHDLKTPLSLIMGPVSLLKERTKDPKTLHTLDTVYSNAVKLNNMIHRVLELNRADVKADGMVIKSSFDVVSLSQSILDDFKGSNPDKLFVFNSDEKSLVVVADIVKLESVITNLLSNACKYSPAGATVSCGISLRGNNFEIVISDDGMGIAAADQPLVFNRMFRSPDAAKQKEGTGIGLYLVKKYVELMGGNISLYSKQGQGTSFTISIPIGQLPESEKRKVNTDSGKKRILVVDDNAQLREFLSDLLHDDYTIQEAGNGKAGLSLAASFSPDVIIVDEMMPVMNGLEMCRRLKDNPRLASLPIIMLTAKDDKLTEKESIEAGVDAFVSKPFDPVTLKARIVQLLKSREKVSDSLRLKAMTDVKPIEAESPVEKQLNNIAKIVEDNISDPDLNVTYLSEKSGLPVKQLYRTIKKYMGITPSEYIRNVRLQQAALLLGQHRFTVSEVCYMVGFKAPSYFSKCFQDHFGVAPIRFASLKNKE